MTRKPILLLIATLICIGVQAQLKSPLSSIKPQLNKVIDDFPVKFASIKGEKENGDPNTIQYKSTVEMNGGSDAKIVGYPSKNRIYWLWETRLFSTEDLAELKRQYKAYYNDIAGKALLTKSNSNNLVATAPYNAPSEALRIWTNQFRMNDETGDFKNMVVDLVAEYINFEWVVYLRVYDREKDEDVRPTNEKTVTSN
jgi:D-alanyl-D-alanine carboxypeptidase